MLCAASALRVALTAPDDAPRLEKQDECNNDRRVAVTCACMAGSAAQLVELASGVIHRRKVASHARATACHALQSFHKGSAAQSKPLRSRRKSSRSTAPVPDLALRTISRVQKLRSGCPKRSASKRFRTLEKRALDKLTSFIALGPSAAALHPQFGYDSPQTG